jgi:hypothetical protein
MRQLPILQQASVQFDETRDASGNVQIHSVNLESFQLRANGIHGHTSFS